MMAVFSAHASNDTDWWSMGPVGGSFQVQSGTSFIAVRAVDVGGPADLAGVQVGDYIMGSYGKVFSSTGSSTSGYKGAPQGFADAIERAESTDGAMPLILLRPGIGSVSVTLNLPVAGAFGPAYPLGSAKFDGIYQQAAGKIHEEIMADADGDVGYMTGFYGVILLADPSWDDSTGDKPYRLSINKMRDRGMTVLNAAVVNPVEATNMDGTPNDGSVNDSDPNDQSYESAGLENWGLSTWAMFLAEYRARTGDTSVDATIQTAADLLAGRIQTWQQPPYAGSSGPTKVGLMGHGGVGGDYSHIGYSGINIVNAHVMTAMAMLKNAGATIDDVKMQATWNWVKGTTNTDGNVGYAWKQDGYDSGGRTAGVAFAMSVYGGLSLADQAVLTTMKDYVSREWQRMQHTHVYTAGGIQFYQFVLPYLSDRDQRFIMENQKMYYHFQRTTTTALKYFGGRENNGGDGYVGTARVAYAGVAMAQAVASGNLKTIASIDTSRIHADFQSPFLTWPTIDARYVEIEALSQDFTVDVTDYQGTSLLPANYTATWTYVSGPATATFTTPNTAGTTVNFPQDGTYRIQLEVVSGGYTLTEPIDVVVDTSGDPVADPPSIVTEPVDQSTTLGASVSMSVTVTGDGPFLYEWFLNGSISMGVDSSSTLNLSNVGGGYVGDYHCVITHPTGTLTTTTVSLTVPDAGILAQGGLWRDQFDGLPSSAMTSLTNHANYPRFPNFGEVVTSAESGSGIGDNYGARWTGWLTPDVTGDYTFYIASDEQSELWLSTDDQPSNKVKIASLTSDAFYRNWDGGGISAVINLTAGQSYYIEVLHTEGAGSDFCSVAWQKPGEGVPVDGSDPISGQYLSYFTGGVQDTAIVLPPVFDSSSYAWNFDETVSLGTLVGTVSATDLNTPLTYAITSGNINGDFAINSSTGEITIANALDFEVTPSYTLTIQATNSISLIGQVTATVIVNDIYDAAFVVDTNFEATDGFTGYSGHATLATTSDNLGAQWSTPNDARIWNNDSIPPLGVQCLTLGVAGNPSTAEIVIPGTDHGVSSVTFDYASFSSSTNVTFALFYRIDGGVWVQAWSDTVVGMTLDWQVKPWTSATVDINQTGDIDLKLETTGTNGVLVDTFRVKDNRPNLPPVANNSVVSILESEAIGTSVGSVDATDPNIGDPLTYAITTGNTGGAFAINATTGEITVAGTLDYAILSQYLLTILVTDTLGLNDTATVTVDINKVILSDDFERPAGTTLGGGWIELINDSRIFDTAQPATKMIISVSAGMPFAIVNQMTDTYVAGERYELVWNASRATSADGVLNYDVSMGTWDGSTFTPLGTQNGSIANLNSQAKVAGPVAYVTATATEAGQQIAVRLEVLAGSADWVGFDDVLVNSIGTNTAPVFSADSLAKTDGIQDAAYSDSIAADATDADVGDTLTYSKVSGPAWLNVIGDGTITGNPANGDVGLNVFTVRVTDAGGVSDDATLNITVININDAPVVNDAIFAIAEDVAVGEVVATVTTSDPDVGDTVSFVITAGNTGNAFAIDAAGVVTTATALDFETEPSYSLTVMVTDGGGLTDTAIVIIDVTNSNEDPVFAADPINESNATEAVAYSGTLAGRASDVDASTTLSYSKISGPAWLVVASDGALSGAPANSDVGSNVFTVQVDDGSGGTDSATLNITVDVASGIIFNDDFERTAGSTIGNGWVEKTNDSRIYDTVQPATKMMISASAGVPFAIVNQLANTYVEGERYELAWNASRATSASGTLVYDVSIGTWDGTTFTPLSAQADTMTGLNLFGKVAGPAVYFTASATVAGQQIAVQFEVVTGSSDWAGFDDITVNALGANTAPVFVVDPLSKANATEDVIYNASIATDSTDADTGDTLIYSKVSGPAWLSLATDGTLTGTPLNDDVGINAFTVRTTDAGGLFADATLNITVDNVNDAPVVNDSSGSIAENTGAGAAVATVIVSDVDAGDTLSYAITDGNTGDAFAIDGGGNITTTTQLDYEILASYTLTITVTDSGALSDTATVVVTVTDVFEASAPVIVTGSSSNLTQISADIVYTVSDDGGEAPTVTVYYGEFNGGTTSGNWTSSAAQGAKVTGGYVAALSGLTEGTTYYFTVHASNSAGESWGSSGSFITEADTSPKMVRTTVNAVSNTSWTSVDLGQSYNSAVIIATPIYPNSSIAPVVTRIRNVSGSGFEVKIDRSDGLTGTVNVDVSIVAVEEGVYTLATDGVTMEAVKYTSTVTARKNNWTAEARTYQNSYTTPVVVGQVMSTNDVNWSIFWSIGSSRSDPVDASNLNVGKHVGEDVTTTRADETIGYIVIEAGSGTINGVAYEAALGADLPEGVGETSTGWTYNLSGGLASASAVALSQSGVDGNDGGYAVLYGATPFTATTITLAIDEDQMTDSERNHVNEQACYIIFE